MAGRTRKSNLSSIFVSACLSSSKAASLICTSFSLTTFSPSGKLVQIEHALAAVAGGNTSLGIKATNGVVLATEKKASSVLLDNSALEQVAPICPNIGFVYAGMGPDFRVLVAKARKIAQAYWKVYGEYPPTKVLVAEVAGVMQKATQSG